VQSAKLVVVPERVVPEQRDQRVWREEASSALFRYWEWRTGQTSEVQEVEVLVSGVGWRHLGTGAVVVEWEMSVVQLQEQARSVLSFGQVRQKDQKWEDRA